MRDRTLHSSKESGKKGLLVRRRGTDSIATGLDGLRDLYWELLVIVAVPLDRQVHPGPA